MATIREEMLNDFDKWKFGWKLRRCYPKEWSEILESVGKSEVNTPTKPGIEKWKEIRLLPENDSIKNILGEIMAEML